MKYKNIFFAEIFNFIYLRAYIKTINFYWFVFKAISEAFGISKKLFIDQISYNICLKVFNK